MPIILATQEAEIRRIAVGSQPRQIVHKTLSRKKSSTKKKSGAGGVAQGLGLEFKPQYGKKKEKKSWGQTQASQAPGLLNPSK
jgi:hypothetical protein